MKRRILLGLVLVSVVAQPVSAAKRLDNAPEPERLTQEQVDAVPYRDLNFTPTAATAGDYHKYFVFHRDDTSFERAFADINECDSLVSGSNIYMGGNDAVTNSVAMQYGMAGAIAGPLVGLAMDAIFGSDSRREQYRAGMKTCMGYKEYKRYGLAGANWKVFHFEEGNGRKDDAERRSKMLMQAKVASGPRPNLPLAED